MNRTLLAKTGQTLLLSGLVIALPLLPRPHLLLTWPVWVAFLAGVILNLTQPHISNKDLSTDDLNDKRSVLVLMIGGLLIFLIPIVDYGWGRQARPQMTNIWSIVGICGMAVGLGFRFWAIRTLGNFFTATVQVQQGQRVIDYGPYRFIRHPSYTGSITMALFLSVTLRSYIGVIFCLVGFLGAYLYRMALEEKSLATELGGTYVDYMRRTKRLIPFIY